MSELEAFLADLTEVSRRHGLRLTLDRGEYDDPPVIEVEAVGPGDVGRYRVDPAYKGVVWE